MNLIVTCDFSDPALLLRNTPIGRGIDLTDWYKHQRYTVIHHIDPDDGNLGDLWNVGFYFCIDRLIAQVNLVQKCVSWLVSNPVHSSRFTEQIRKPRRCRGIILKFSFWWLRKTALSSVMRNNYAGIGHKLSHMTQDVETDPVEDPKGQTLV
jgi:hypothetical protein